MLSEIKETQQNADFVTADELIPGNTYTFDYIEDKYRYKGIYAGKIYVWEKEHAISIDMRHEKTVLYSNKCKEYYMFVEQVKNCKDVLKLLQKSLDFKMYKFDVAASILTKNFIYRVIPKKSHKFIKEASEACIKNTYSEEHLNELLENARKKLNKMIRKEQDYILSVDKLEIPGYVLFSTATCEVPFDFSEEQKRFFELTGTKPELRKE